MLVQVGEKITLLKGFHPYGDSFTGCKAGDKMVVMSFSYVNTRVDRDNKLVLCISFEKVRGSYWVPIDWIKCRESVFKELLDE